MTCYPPKTNHIPISNENTTNFIGYSQSIDYKCEISYCRFAVAAGEVPSAFVSVTVTDNTEDGLPFTVNGCVSVNWLPKGAELELPYHCVKSEVMDVLN